ECKTFEMYDHMTEHTKLAVSSDGRYLVSGGGTHRDGFTDTSLRVWKLNDEAEIAKEGYKLGGHAGVIKNVVISPDGKYIISVDGETMVKWSWTAERCYLEWSTQPLGLFCSGTQWEGANGLSSENLSVLLQNRESLDNRGHFMPINGVLRE